jgi:hypothetical protein
MKQGRDGDIKVVIKFTGRSIAEKWLAKIIAGVR